MPASTAFMSHALNACIAAQAPVHLAAFSPDARYCLTAASGERHVALWTLPARVPGSKKLKKGVATAVLSMEEAAIQLHVTAADASTKGTGFDVCVITDSGEVHVWQCREVAEALEVTKLAVVRVGAR
jgi:hypothetical protein